MGERRGVRGDWGGKLVLGDCGTLPVAANADDISSTLILLSIIEVSTASS